MKSMSLLLCAAGSAVWITTCGAQPVSGAGTGVGPVASESSCVWTPALPNGLQPGQFRGLFLENVETEFTTDLIQ
jgi:hypothetical protein